MLYRCSQWISDIDNVLSVIPEIDSLSGKSVLITGAAGLICSSVVDILFRYNDTHENIIQIYAAGRWMEEMKNRFAEQVYRSDFHFIKYDAARNDNQIDIHVDYIIHGASNAHPALVMKEPVETMMSNFCGMKYLLDYARNKGVQRVLYISSSEVYGNKPGDSPYKENEYGYIDLLNSRNSYSIGKRATETLCASYSIEYGVECVIVRPGHVYGPTASPNDNRVSSAWAYNAAKGEDILMMSGGEQIRSYCYCLDCASAIIKTLLCGENNHAYNISNPDSVIRIRELGQILANVGGVKLTITQPTDAEKKSFNPMNNSSLESQSLLNLGWHGCFNADEGLEHTVRILKEIYCF